MALRPGRPPRFKPWLPPQIKPAIDPERKYDDERGSSRERGYSPAWNRASEGYRRKHPFCRMCEQEGRVGLTAVVDHIKPAKEFPELFWDRENWQGLCEYHDGIKQRMENLARKTGQLDQLPLWCSSVEARPRGIQVAPRPLE